MQRYEPQHRSLFIYKFNKDCTRVVWVKFLRFEAPTELPLKYLINYFNGDCGSVIQVVLYSTIFLLRSGHAEMCRYRARIALEVARTYLGNTLEDWSEEHSELMQRLLLEIYKYSGKGALHLCNITETVLPPASKPPPLPPVTTQDLFDYLTKCGCSRDVLIQATMEMLSTCSFKVITQFLTGLSDAAIKDQIRDKIIIPSKLKHAALTL